MVPPDQAMWNTHRGRFDRSDRAPALAKRGCPGQVMGLHGYAWGRMVCMGMTVPAGHVLHCGSLTVVLLAGLTLFGLGWTVLEFVRTFCCVGAVVQNCPIESRDCPARSEP